VEARLQRRIQRYGWDRAVGSYARCWEASLAALHAEVLALAGLQAGERVLDIACGPGALSLNAARRVGASGQVLGVDLSDAMVTAARESAQRQGLTQARFSRMDAESLSVPGASVDVALCTLGLMYLPDPPQALSCIYRALRPGGRAVLAVWGERRCCGWAPLFEIIDAEVRSEVCPLFFALGRRDALARACADAGLLPLRQRRFDDQLRYADAADACEAAFAGGPVALAWSRLDDAARGRVRQRYLDAIEPWRQGTGYAIPAQYVLVLVQRPMSAVAT
jgi:ubiquinone/menaquinone biosynthesis C-methylase UbiE